ncbi:MAG: hypothetical protein WA376_16775 [Terrimicrobiaceae bacterium]
MFLLQQALPGLLVAALLSGMVAFAGRLWRANNWGDAVALAMGYAGGHAVTIGWPPFPASEATQWLPYVALATMFVGVLDTLLQPPGMLRALVWICYCAGLLRLLLSPKFQYGWSLLEGVFWIAGLALGMLTLASFLDAAVRRDKSVSSPLILTIVACGTGVALMLSGSALLGQMAIVLVAALGAILVVTFLFPKSIEGRAIVPVAVAILASLWLMGFFYAELPSASALLLAAALLPGCLLISFSESRAFSWKAILLRAGVVLALVAISVVIAFRSSPPLEY